MSSDTDIYEHQNFGNPLGMGNKVALLMLSVLSGLVPLKP